MASQPLLRASPRQMEALVDFLERNPEIATGLLRKQQGKVETRKKWTEFATAANALGGLIKDGYGWAKYWSEKKSALRTRCRERSNSMRRTGGGVDILSELSSLEQRIVAVLGGLSFATGDKGLAVNPFPSQPSPSITQPSTSRSDSEPMVVVVVADNEDQFQDSPQAPVEASPQVDTVGPTGGATPQVETVGPTGGARPQVETVGHTGGARPQVETVGHTATRRARAPPLNQQDRPSRSVTFLDAQVRRFEEIESRRVEAEAQTAQALGQIAAAFTEMVAVIRNYLERDRQNHPPN